MSDALARLPAAFRPAPLAAIIRLAVIVPALVAAAVVPHQPAVIVGGVVVGVLVAMVRPGVLGSSVLIVVELAGWIYRFGGSADVAAWRTIVFAAALYVAHTAVSLAAAVPIAAEVDPVVALRWAIRAAPGVLAAVVAGLVVAGLGSPDGSRWLDVVGLGAATLAVAALVWLVRTAR